MLQVDWLIVRLRPYSVSSGSTERQFDFALQSPQPSHTISLMTARLAGAGNSLRFLRRRFVDPFTGKDEWRIIHTNGGFLTDSLVQKPPTDSQGKQSGNTTTNATNSTNSPDEPPQVNAAVLQRPSDRPLTPTGFGQPSGVQQDQSGQQLNTPLPPITLQPPPGQSAALPPITLQSGLNQPGGLPPITLAPTGPAGGQPIPGQIRRRNEDCVE